MAGMNMWIAAATALMLGYIPCGIVCSRGRTLDRLIGSEMASVLTVIILLMWAQGTNRASFFDLAISMALLSLPGSLIFVHYLERWR